MLMKSVGNSEKGAIIALRENSVLPCGKLLRQKMRKLRGCVTLDRGMAEGLTCQRTSLLWAILLSWNSLTKFEDVCVCVCVN